MHTALGSQFVLRHADRIAWGWFAPGITTVLIDCLGQAEGVWRFPPQRVGGHLSFGRGPCTSIVNILRTPSIVNITRSVEVGSRWRGLFFPHRYLSGIGIGYLRLDIVLVYMVSTLAVTGTGACILAATEELSARRERAGRPPPSLGEIFRYIAGRKLEEEKVLD